MMFSDENSLSEYRFEDISKVAISTYVGIMQQWNISGEDQLLLLGFNGDVSTEKLMEPPFSLITPEVLERISFVLKIYKCLQILFPECEQSNTWIKKANDAFGGDSALAVILGDRNNGLLKVAEHLINQLEIPNEFLEKSVQKEFILSLVLEWAGSTENAINWYESQMIPALGMTPQRAVECGNYNLVLKYLEGVSLGGYA
ncbi:hypothetical protein L2735_14490 [Shewanella olleyana]|uniref:hypothetical protein n=1 Tax=Shewanella olleyana TaxID=135626 RepID=UPI00200E0818|nr:hypothetical protein [Shewanella olleyana]MCL1068000.1 hypothetical protein [Shewanella olleyana]